MSRPPLSYELRSASALGAFSVYLRELVEFAEQSHDPAHHDWLRLYQKASYDAPFVFWRFDWDIIRGTLRDHLRLESFDHIVPVCLAPATSSSPAEPPSPPAASPPPLPARHSTLAFEFLDYRNNQRKFSKFFASPTILAILYVARYYRSAPREPVDTSQWDSRAVLAHDVRIWHDAVVPVLRDSPSYEHWENDFVKRWESYPQPLVHALGFNRTESRHLPPCIKPSSRASLLS